MKKKILVTFVEAGMGHITTAQAVLDALNLCKDEDVEIIPKNIFHENDILRKYEQFLVNQTKKSSSSPLHSRAQLVSMHLLGSQNTLKLVNGFIYGKQKKLYIEELKKIKPDIIIDTHYFTSYASVCYRDKYAPDCKVVTYDPDNNVHGWWDRRVDYFIVNNEQALDEAINKRKFSKEKVKRVFFITRQGVVNCNESKDFYRKKYNIPHDQFAVKLADGAYANAKMRSFVYELCKTDKPLTIVAIAGRNKKLYNELMEFKKNLPKNVNLMPFEFVPEVYEICKACDLFITKGGPNAVLDSVFVQTPVVINYYANNIEGTTKKLFVDRLGCGLFIKNKVRARKFVEDCVDNPKILQPFVKNEQKLDKTQNGAQEIADFVLELVQKS
ncbi:MAG: glycosyltransferase [Candidatus Caccovivens sp.]